jgi:ribose transport system substrate-binding protein
MSIRKAFALVAVLGLTIAACGRDDESSSSSGTTGDSVATSPEPTTADSAVPSDQKFVIGLVPFSSADPTSNQAMVGIQDVAKKYGWETSLIDAQGSADQAISAIQNLIQKDVDIIITTVFPAESLAGGVLAAQEAGIPVGSLGGGVGDGVQADWDVGTEQGVLLAQKIIADTGGEGKLLALGYSPGLPCRQREAGLDAALVDANMDKSRQEVEIPGQVESGTKFTEGWLAANSADSATQFTIWGCFDDPAIGAISALKQAGRDDVRVYGLNGTPQALDAIRSGDMAATVWINAYGAGTDMGEAIPQIVAAGVNGGPLQASAPSVLVDLETLDAFLAEYPDAANAQ